MADEIPQTPVPVPTYGQPQPAAPVVAQNQPGETSTTPEGQTIAPTTETGSKDIAMADASSADQAPVCCLSIPTLGGQSPWTQKLGS